VEFSAAAIVMALAQDAIHAAAPGMVFANQKARGDAPGLSRAGLALTPGLHRF
jgi:hypothetical protein